jgi:hypothetical protein
MITYSTCFVSGNKNTKAILFFATIGGRLIAPPIFSLQQGVPMSTSINHPMPESQANVKQAAVNRVTGPVGRRDFLASASALAVAGLASGSGHLTTRLFASPIDQSPESLVKTLYDSLSEQQRQAVCFDWDYTSKDRGLLRTRVANNWNITKPTLLSDFYTQDQRDLVKTIFEGMIDPTWHDRFYKQFKDDMGGWGKAQSLAIFGTPGTDRFEFVLTGRHSTLRCDGNTQKHVAFGGPIFYGHAAGSDDEGTDHPGNVFWEQALAANGVYQMLDGKQRKMAEVAESPSESAVAFRPSGPLPGIPVSELSRDQREALQKVLSKLIEPFRKVDRDEAVACLNAQGGLDKLHLAFYTDEDSGGDKVWDNWRLEGPSFVWHFRGYPHVHVWVNIADDPSVPLNA